MRCSGRIVKKMFAPGSKSEHEAVFLVTEDREFPLRRLGGNPFRDEELERLVGHQIRCEGNVAGATFIMSQWDVVDEEPAKE